MEESDRLDSITRRIIGAAIQVHRQVGPGLLESAYETCLAFELRQLGFKVEQQKPLPVVYKDVRLDCGYRLDLVVDDAVIVGDQSRRTTGTYSRCATAFVLATIGKAGRIADQFSCQSSQERLEENSQ